VPDVGKQLEHVGRQEDDQKGACAHQEEGHFNPNSLCSFW
jgi:hypothetical protein